MNARSGITRFLTPLIGGMLIAVQASAQTPVSYEFFRDKVQPIFTAKRTGHALCIECHDNQAPRVAEIEKGATTWTEEQSRRNYDAWKNFVVPGEPGASRMLMHPLAKEAGGDPFHAGGKHFKTKNDPEWKILEAWVMTGSSAAVASNTSKLDYGFYKKNVEPILLKDRAANEGTGNACFSCHTRMASRMRLQPTKEGTTVWTDEQSKANFEVVARLVTPGDPAKSRLLLHPLAVKEGGDPTHTGGKFWPTKDHAEWKTIAAWIQGEKVQ